MISLYSTFCHWIQNNIKTTVRHEKEIMKTDKPKLGGNKGSYEILRSKHENSEKCWFVLVFSLNFLDLVFHH